MRTMIDVFYPTMHSPSMVGGHGQSVSAIEAARYCQMLC